MKMIAKVLQGYVIVDFLLHKADGIVNDVAPAVLGSHVKMLGTIKKQRQVMVQAHVAEKKIVNAITRLKCFVDGCKQGDNGIA